MSVQRLSEKKIRRLAETTDMDVVRAWRLDNYTVLFATAAHRHYSGEIERGQLVSWREYDDDSHLTSCYGFDRELLVPLTSFVEGSAP